MLTNDEKTYYARQLILPKFGKEGQSKLKRANIAVIGAGGLACPALPYLVGAGVGKITLIDGDKVSETNLHRQILFSTLDIGKHKAEVIKEKLSTHNPHVEIKTITEYLQPSNAISVLKGHDLIVDCTDNYATRYLINDTCVLLNIPMVYGAIHRFEGQVGVFNYQNGPTYRCLFPEPPTPASQQNCAEAGVLGILPGVIGLMQATEVIKIIAELGNVLSGKVMCYNSLNYSFQTIKIKRKPETFIHSVFINGKLNPEAYQLDICIKEELEITMEEIEFSKINDYLWIDVRELNEKPIIPNELPIKKAPLSTFDEHMKEIDVSRSIILFCKSGRRSLKAAEILKQQGVGQVKSLNGGINQKIIEAWKKNLQYSSSMDR